MTTCFAGLLLCQQSDSQPDFTAFWGEGLKLFQVFLFCLQETP